MLSPELFFTSEGESWTSQYTINKVLGQGTFGMVVLATISATGEKVAIKRVRLDSGLQNRELGILKELLAPPATTTGSSLSSSLNSPQGSPKSSTAPAMSFPLPLLNHHPNIVKLKTSFLVTDPSTGLQYLNIVMSYVPQDLRHLKKSMSLHNESHNATGFPLLMAKVILFQLARALAFMHHKNIAHRDIKPANILVDPESFRVQLCDLGSAKQIPNPASSKNVSYICSRYYRAPELLFGSLHYGCEVDLWSFGCVAAELFRSRGNVLFKGSTTVDQMTEIFKVLGAPSKAEMNRMNPQCAAAMSTTHEYYQSTGSFPSKCSPADRAPFGDSDYDHHYNVLKISALPMEKVLSKSTPASGVDLIRQLLTYSPQKRLSAVQILEHEFFADLFTSTTEKKNPEIMRLPNGKLLPIEMFLLTHQEKEYLPTSVQEKMTREANRIKSLMTKKQ